ncbi:hypothetical protein PVAND_007279 [Polypedilum vanderplanki]|uniref:DDE-1 domain-containing protein n=1 Tax=Polypedilum vanderplanki TaxID=319348 RepID=A0A9J6C5R9_POLVA|nr:hypothetical protein PVAND_007279 [Polypedilum vanderplanki]
MISKAAATVCEEDIDNFFTKFENWLKGEGLTDLLNKPERFFNLDETCFDLNSPPQRVLAEKGSKTVYPVNGSKIHDNITATFCFSASGDVLPPQIIFNKAFSKIEDVSYAAGELRTKFLFSQTEKGWQNKESFKNYIEKLDEELNNRKIERPVIFFFDGHASHTNIDLYLWCKERKIILVVFPPNATHLLQMCDTTIFAPTKKRWRSEVNDYKKEFKRIDIDQVDFIKILSRVMKKTMTPESIKNGFRGTGIFPLNRNNIHRDRLIGTLPTYASSTLPKIVHKEVNEIMEIDGYEENSIQASYHAEAFESNDVFVEQGPSTTIKITNENSLIPPLDCNQLTEREKKLINEMKQLNSQLMDSLKHKNSQHYLNSLIISQQLNLIDPVNNFSPFNVSHINIEEIKEPILPAPATFSRKGLSRRKKIMNGVMTSNEIIEMHLAEIREKERLQKEKDDRKLIREQRKLIKENTMHIKMEQEKENEYQNVVFPKKRGRKPKSVLQND